MLTQGLIGVPCNARTVGHRQREDLRERRGRDYVAKRDRCTRGGSHGSGVLTNQAWKPWDATTPRRGGEGAGKWCMHEINVV